MILVYEFECEVPVQAIVSMGSYRIEPYAKIQASLYMSLLDF